MSNVLNEDQKQQVIALGRLGWPLRRIEQATGVRRETASAYLKAAGIAIRSPGGWGRRSPAKTGNGVTPDSESKPAKEVTPDFVRLILEKSAIPLPASTTSPSSLRTISRNHRTGTGPRPQWQGHLAGFGIRVRI